MWAETTGTGAEIRFEPVTCFVAGEFPLLDAELLPVESVAFTAMGIQSPTNLEKYGGGGDLLRNPVGTGPFMFDSYSPREMTVLKKNPKYFRGEPILEKVADELQGKALITSLNIEENREAAYRLNIHSIPTLVLFNDGEETRRFIGLQKADSLTKALEDA